MALIILFTNSAYAATQLKKTVKPDGQGGDYTSLEACMNDNEQDLVANDKYFDVEIDGDWSGGADTTPVVIENYNTDATHYINIYTTETARHKGVYSENYYRIELSANGTDCIKSYAEFIRITGIQTKSTFTDDSG